MDENVILKPTKWVNNGYTLAYLDGITYFIVGAIPGEEVDCEVLLKKKNIRFVRVIKIIQKAKNRIPLDCEYFIKCGGCSFRQIPYQDELLVKKNLLFNELNELGVEIVLHRSYSKFYRNTVQFTIDKTEKSVGFKQKYSNLVVDLRSKGCQNLPSKLNEFIQNIKIESSLSNQLKLRYLNKQIIHYDKEPSEYTFLKKRINIPPNGFMQINKYLINRWVVSIVNLEIIRNQKIVELFSGSGFISNFVADKVHSLHGFELDAKAVRAAIQNAKINKLTNLHFSAHNLYKKKLPSFVSESKTWIINPPRKGLNEFIIKQIYQYSPSNIVYSSCDYVTLGRDYKIFRKQGYHITECLLFDFFPRTEHFETLLVLRK